MIKRAVWPGCGIRDAGTERLLRQGRKEKTMLKAVIFDMDGTLLDSEVIHYIVINDILKRELGWEQTPEEYLKYCGIPDQKMWPMILDELDRRAVMSLARKWGMSSDETLPSGGALGALPQGNSGEKPAQPGFSGREVPEQVKAALSAELERLHWAEYDLYIEKNGVKAFPGVRELMEALRAEKIRIAVATGSLVRIVRENLKLLEIEEFVEEIATSEDCDNGKPAPDVFLLAAKKLGVDPADCLVVEDAGNGLQGALSAGMSCAGFEGSELPSDVALAPVVFADYREVGPADMREWHSRQKAEG